MLGVSGLDRVRGPGLAVAAYTAYTAGGGQYEIWLVAAELPRSLNV